MRIYRALLHLYPASFRASFGDELTAMVTERLRQRTGFLASAAVWIEAVWDLVRNASLMHLELTAQDLRDTLRSLARAPGFATTAILVSALGIGATTTTFSIADHVLLRPLPYDESDRLVRLWQDQSFRGYPQMELSPTNYIDWKRIATSFEGMAAFASHAANLVGQGEPNRIDGAAVTPDLFAVLRSQAAYGRALMSADGRDDAAPVIVLSNGLWRTTFGADPQVLGRTVLLNDVPHVVAGVMPPAFQFPNRSTQYWVPLRFSPASLADRTDSYLNTVARLRSGVSLDQARTEMRIVASQLERGFPRENAGTSATVHLVRDQVSTQSRTLLLALVGASLCMLLIACANLANLLLARALVRQRELAVRAAIGAGWRRIFRQMMTESLALALAGGTLGVLLAITTTPLVSRLVPTALPIADVPTVDLRLLAVAAALTLATGLAFGILPALRIVRGQGTAALREGAGSGTSRSTERIRSTLVVAEIAASVVLLVSAALLVRAMWRVQQIDPGFRSGNVLTLRTVLPATKYRTTALRQQFYDRVVGDIRALPGVTSAAYISYLPMVMRGGIWPVILDTSRLSPESRESWAPDPTETRMASFRLTTPGFFASLGVPVRAGRDLSDTDTFESPWVAVVSQSFADQMWPGENPLGRRFFMAFREREVVGVVGTIRVRGLERESEPQVYVPSRQAPDEALLYYSPKDLVVSAAVPVETLVPQIRSIVTRVDPQQPLSQVRLLSDIVNDETAPRRAQVQVLVGFAAVAFLLAAVGVHGLLAFAVSSRTREIGVRIALGARSGEIVGMVMRRGARLAVVGALLGTGLAYAAGRIWQSILAGVSPADPPTFAASLALTVLMTLIGCLLPALRALRVDPIAAIRSD